MLVSGTKRLRLWMGLSALALALVLSVIFATSGTLAGVPTGSLAASPANSLGSGGLPTMPLHSKNGLRMMPNGGKPSTKLAGPDTPATSALILKLDDGTSESQVGFGCRDCQPQTEAAAIWVNRFTPQAEAYPISLQSIQIYWPDQGPNNPQFMGLHLKLLIYQDISGSGNFANSTLIYQSDATVGVINDFQTYPVTPAVTLTDPNSDIYVGFEDSWAVSGGFTPRLYPAAIDTDNSQQRSWFGTMADGTGWPPDIEHPNTLTLIGTIDSFGLPGNWMIRASGQAASATCPGVQAANQPPLVVIFVPGIKSQLPANEDYYPVPSLEGGHPVISHYCRAGGDWVQSTALINFVMETYNGSPPPPQGITSLTDRLAALGAVLLPFSYNGARFVHPAQKDSARSYLFHVENWDYVDSTDYDIYNQANNLAQEAESVRQRWPTVPIVVIADSGGGLPAEIFWQAHVGGQGNGIQVFSLDSPVNGVRTGYQCLTSLRCTPYLLGAPGPHLINQYNELWATLRDHDHYIANLDADLSFHAIGSRGDKAFDPYDAPSDGLFSQLVWDCNSSGGCTSYSSQPPLPTDINFENNAPAYPGDHDNHGSVTSRPLVINYIMGELIYPSVGSPSEHQAALGASDAASAPHSMTPQIEPTMETSDPSGIMTPQVLLPGQAATISGHGFTSTSGQVQFDAPSGGFAFASITSWTDTQIGITVPTTATTGLVYVLVPSYPPPVMVGAATLLGSNNGVASLSVAPGAPALWNQPITITITARDGAGQPLPNKPVAVSVGVTETITQTGPGGAAIFPLIGINPQSFVVHSGSVYTSTTVAWQQPPTMTLTLNASSVIPSTGAPVTVTAILSDEAHNPVPNQPVSFNIIGSSSLQLSADEASTDQTGTATTTVTNTGSESFIVGAVADDYTASANVIIRPLVESWLVGHANWQGRPTQPSPLQQVPITLTLKSGSTELNYPAYTTTASGLFTASVSGLLTGTYSWRVKSPKYLANSGTVTLTGTLTTNLEVGLMKAGDCNNDNLITVLDFNILRPTFGRGIGDPGYDDRSEFTGDGRVNVSDFNLLRGNFGAGGAPPISPGAP